MLLYGARMEELIGLMSHIATYATDWQSRYREGFVCCTGSICGISLALRHVYLSSGLYRVTLLGNGWQADFTVTRSRPKHMPRGQHSEMHEIVSAPPNVIGQLNQGGATWARKNEHTTLCFHGHGVSGLASVFQQEMALLRMFSSEWE